MKTYNEFINELALNINKNVKISRLNKSNILTDKLKNYRNEIVSIRNLCKVMQYDEIKYEQNADDIEAINVTFNDEIQSRLSILLDNIKQEDENIQYMSQADGDNDPYLTFDISKHELNRIDISNSLPTFLKGIGLGKKIYKKLIYDLNYIASYNGYEPSDDSNRVWNSLSKDKEIFTFVHRNNIICFNINYEYSKIIDVLKIFYTDYKNMFFDDDFLEKYELTDDELEKIIKLI